MRTLTAVLAIAAAGLGATLVAQPAPRRATTVAALKNYPGFYNQQTVLVVGDVRGEGERRSIGSDEASVRLIARDYPEGRVEARGQFLDIGRISQDDPRLIPFNLLDLVRTAYADRWPRPGEELVLIVSSTAPPPAASDIATPPLRTLAMEPDKFAGRPVTIQGQFRGRNLFGDLPEAPLNNKWQFVLRSTDAAVWVMGLQPKGKTFNFDPNKRIDSGRWVKVAGTVRTAKGLTWLEGTSIELAQAPAETATEVTIAAPPPPPVEVLFAAPSEGEADVRLDERIRLQLSRDLDPATLKGRIRITYSSSESRDRGEAQPPEVTFATTYSRENRALEIRPAQPLERFRAVKVEFLEGIKGTDGGAMAPFTLTFTTGGS
jgi:hypothetical protein